MMILDPTITFGNIIEITAIVGGGLLVLVKQGNSIYNVKEQMKTVREELKKLHDVITRMAVADNRLSAVEEDVRDLRRGRGFITEGRNSINREFPATKG